jgi:hypothetical protein
MSFRSRLAFATLALLAGCSSSTTSTTPDLGVEAPPDMAPDIQYPPDGGATSCERPTAIACDAPPKTDDNSTGANWIDQYLCTALANSGPEVYYSFTTPETKIVTVDVTVDDPAQDLDLFVLDQGCDASSCVARSTEPHGVVTDGGVVDEHEHARFAAAAGTDYRIVVDGYLDRRDALSRGTSGYTISVTCSAPTCTPPGTVVDCTTTDLPGNNGQAGSTNELETYGCGGDETGPEYIYTFVSGINGQVTVMLNVGSPTVTDLDLFVLEDDGTGCNVVNCAGASATLLDEQVTFDVTVGKTYYFVVDGHAESRGDYQISLDCNGTVPPDGGPDGATDGPTGG